MMAEYTSLQLSREEGNLYNPAFVGAIIYNAVRHHQRQGELGLHCSLVYLVVPLAIYPRYSSVLPATVATPLAGWAAEHEGLLLGLRDDVHFLIEVVNAALVYLLGVEAVHIGEDSRFYIKEDRIPQSPALIAKCPSLKACFSSAAMLGRWLSTVHSIDAVYVYLGVRP